MHSKGPRSTGHNVARSRRANDNRRRPLPHSRAAAATAIYGGAIAAAIGGTAVPTAAAAAIGGAIAIAASVLPNSARSLAAATANMAP